MKIQDITSFLESVAPPMLAEGYDNTGLLVGNKDWECTGILVSLDATEEVVLDAIHQNCNLIVAHHPILFKGLKNLNGNNYIEKAVIAAIKNDIAIYAIHTNLDNIITGVNGRMADRLGLTNRQVLSPSKNMLKKLAVFVPNSHAEKVRAVIFEAGGGQVGNYSECSFSSMGQGTFKAGDNTNPFVGSIGEQHHEDETKIEIIFPAWLEKDVQAAMLKAHPYEEVAYDIYSLDNTFQQTGSGMIGELEQEQSEYDFLHSLQAAFDLQIIRHTPFTGKMVKKVALCGGAGSFLTGIAIAKGAQFYITGDVKYHEFFDANQKLVIADIGHYESEQYTIDLLFDTLREKFRNFAIQKTAIITNPVNYFVSSKLKVNA